MIEFAEASAELIERSVFARQRFSSRRSVAESDDALTPAQRSSLTSTLDGVAEALGESADKLVATPGPPLYAELEQQLNRLESARSLIDAVLSQRQEHEMKRALQLADACALAGFERFQDPNGDERRAPPIVLIEPQESPAMTFPRASVVAPRFLGETKLTTLVPMLYVPPSYVWSLAQLSTLQHEIGHVCDDQYQLRQRFSALLPGLLPGEEWDELGPRRRRQCWTNWMKEVLADVIGVVLGGSGFALTLTRILVGRGEADNTTVDSSYGSLYPPGRLRLYLLELTLRMLGVDYPLTAGVAEGPLAKLAADLSLLLPRLLHDPIAGLSAGSLANLADTADEDRLTRALTDALLKGHAPPPQVSVRLLPGALQHACREAPERSLQLHTQARALVDQLTTPNWVMSERQLSSLRDQAKQRPAILDEIDGRTKVPPRPLLKEHAKIAFVGATHWQLVANLQAAHAERGHGWESLEVFVLAETQLAWFESASVSKADLQRSRGETVAALSRLLPEIAQRWAIYEYQQPLFFGSYWDWEERHGRIHVSPAVWGLELKSCPGQDYLRGDVPSLAYAAYETGLAELRRRSTTLHGSL